AVKNQQFIHYFTSVDQVRLGYKNSSLLAAIYILDKPVGITTLRRVLELYGSNFTHLPQEGPFGNIQAVQPHFLRHGRTGRKYITGIGSRVFYPQMIGAARFSRKIRPVNTFNRRWT